MMNLFRCIFPPCWPVFWSAVLALAVALSPSLAAAAEPPSEKELSTMGQGFGKFVGSFMRQVQSDEEKKAAPAEERRTAERREVAADPVLRRDPGEGRSSRSEAGERRYVPYRLYDPWGAARWGDPVLGFNPWGQSNSWVDYDWNARKWQYGWSYGGASPSYGWRGSGGDWGGYGGRYGGEMPYAGSHPEEDRYPAYGYPRGDRQAGYAGDPSLREGPSWGGPGGYGSGWDREGRGEYSAEDPRSRERSSWSQEGPQYRERGRPYGGMW